MHPAVYRAIEAAVRALERIGEPLVVVEIPLLYESGHEREFDRVVVTVCREDTQVARLVGRGLSETRARQVLAAQMPTAEKAARADYVIDTDGDTARTDEQVLRVLNDLR